MKTCSCCKRKLPLSEFGSNRWEKDGLNRHCRECVREKRHRQQDEEFNQLLGCYKIYILNHIKQGERKYNVVATSGKVFATNDKAKFVEFLEAIFNGL